MKAFMLVYNALNVLTVYFFYLFIYLFLFYFILFYFIYLFFFFFWDSERCGVMVVHKVTE